jgi:hypothetical protein
MLALGHLGTGLPQAAPNRVPQPTKRIEGWDITPSIRNTVRMMDYVQVQLVVRFLTAFLFTRLWLQALRFFVISGF